MKILHFIPVYAPAWTYGGPVRSVSSLCESLVSCGHQVTVATTNAGLPVDEYPFGGRPVTRNGVTVYYFGNTGTREIRSSELATSLRKLIAAHDIIHVTSIWQRCAFAVHSEANRLRRRVVVSPRGSLGGYAWQRRKLLKVIFYALLERPHLRRAAGFHFTSEAERLESIQYCKDRPNCIIPNGIDHTIWFREDTPAAELRKSLRLRAGAKLLLYAGRMHHKKGLEIVPEVFSRLLSHSWANNYHMLFVGSDEDGTLKRIRQEFCDRRMVDRVHVFPTLDSRDLRAAYSAADAFVLPSLHENFGNAAMEALACGCPAIVSAETASLEFGGGLGLFPVNDRSASAWAEAIRNVLVRPREETVDVKALRERIGIERTARLMAGFYQSITRFDTECSVAHSV